MEQILDWRPTDYVTHRTTMPNGFSATSTFAFADNPDGTRVRLLFTWGKTRKEREEQPATRDFLAGLVERGQENLHAVLTGEMARRASVAAATPPEPAAPESLDREIREPIRR